MIILQESALKQRLAEEGLSIPPGGVAASPEQASELAEQVGCPVVVKALVPLGDRGGRGLVVPAASAPAVRDVATRLLGSDVEGHRVGQLRVESQLPPGADFYLAVTFDFARGVPLLLWGDGGSGVERWLTPHRQTFTLGEGPDPERLPSQLRRAVPALCRVFTASKARLVELNPLRVIDERPVVLDAKAVLDPVNPIPDDAKLVDGRASDRALTLARKLSELGTTSKVQYRELPGDIGLVMWGGGSTMIILDALQRAGLRPANYSDMAAGTLPSEVIGLLAETALRPTIRGAIVGSTVSSALSAIEVARALDRAITASRARQDAPIPIAVRLAGQDEVLAKELLEQQANVRHFGRDSCLEDAVAWLAQQLVAT